MEMGIDIKQEIEKLLTYGVNKKFIHQDDICLIRNQLYDLLGINCQNERYEPCEEIESPDDILNIILQFCYETGLLKESSISERDKMTAKIMGVITPRSSEVGRRFNILYAQSPMEATDYLYNLYTAVEKVQLTRVNKRNLWDHEEDYGRIECAISFTEQENPRVTTREAEVGDSYPKCRYCYQRVGYNDKKSDIYGQNLRLVKQILAEETWYFGFSPLAHFNEHCIVALDRHEPHRISHKTFIAMVEFVDKYPHYFMSVEADLPLVGIKGHSRMIGGCDIFPIEYVEATASYTHRDYSKVEFHTLNWPISTIRIESDDLEQITSAANHIYTVWKGYTDEGAGIKAFTEGDGLNIEHNTISAVARKNNRGIFVIDIFLRNNFASPEFPNGVYNTPDIHRNIVADFIGITNVMGRIVLPGEMDNELLHIMSYLMSGKPYVIGTKEVLDKHAQWIEILQNKYGIIKNYPDAKRVMQFEVGRKFAKILDSCGVFKQTDEGMSDFKLFVLSAGLSEIDGW